MQVNTPKKPAGFTLVLLRIAATLIALFAAISLSLFLLGQFWPQIRATDTFGREVNLPWYFQGKRIGATLNLEVERTSFSPTSFHVVPDEQMKRITVNGKDFPLETLNQRGLSDYVHGFSISFSSYFQRGKNTVQMVIDNHHWRGGIAILPRLRAHALLLGLCFVPLAYALSRSFSLSRYALIAVLLSLLGSSLFWGATSWDERAYDVNAHSGHVGYIEYIAREGKLPDPKGGWAFYHPPLYYLIGYAVRQWGKLLGAPFPTGLQALSLTLWLFYLVPSVALVERWLQLDRRGAKIAILLVALWPGNYFQSLRVGNDLAFYACCGLSLYFLFSWLQSADKWRLPLAALFAALTLMAKSNGTVVYAILGLAMLLRLIAERTGRAEGRTPLWAWPAVAATCALGVLGNVFNTLQHNRPISLVSNADGLDDPLRVPVNLAAYLPLNLPTFLTSPWVSSRGNDTGRENFWNFLLRSSLSGEFRYRFPGAAELACLLGFLLLIFFLVVLWKSLRNLARPRVLWRNFWRDPLQHLILLSGLIWLASSLVLRTRVPFSCSNDFRYVLPIVVPLSVVLARQNKAILRWLQVGFCAVGLLFAALVCAFV